MEEFTRALVADMPILMHGSGDVEPNSVDSAAANLVASLTSKYVSGLVDAAVSAHDVLTDGGGGHIPPPPPPRERKRRRSYVDLYDPNGDEDVRDDDQRSDHNNVNDLDNSPWDEGWDCPLRFPPQTATTTPTKPPSPPLSSPTSPSSTDLSGIDLFPNITRRAYASIPSAMGTQCFIFPICHDSELYGRVMEIQAAKRNLAVHLQIGTLVDATAEEAVNALADGMFGWVGRRATGVDVTEPVEEIDELRNILARNYNPDVARRMDLETRLPGLDSLLPTH